MTTQPDPAPILELITAFRRSKTMFAAVRMGIFDVLEAEAQSAGALAEKLHLNAAATARLMNGCVALGLLAVRDGIYSNSALASRYLVSTSPDTLAGYIVYSDQSLFALWSHLGDAVREGAHRWEQAFGSRASLFEFYFRDDNAAANFLGGMHGFGQISSAEVVRAFDLSRFNHLVDLGGATGHLAIAACQAYPKLRATVLDLPIVEKFARDHISRSLVSSRIDFVARDFFADDLPGADLYSLGRILHDWNEQKIARLLNKIAGQLQHGGALLIAETILDESKTAPVASVMQDLNMLVCTEGRERSENEYRRLLCDCGFTEVTFARTGSLVDAILASRS